MQQQLKLSDPEFIGQMTRDFSTGLWYEAKKGCTGLYWAEAQHAPAMREATPNPFRNEVFTEPVELDIDPVFKEMALSIGHVLTMKGRRYGNSALQPLSVFGVPNPNEKSKLGTRIDDKLARVANSPVLRKNDVCDLIGYLMLVCKEKGWLNFEDQID